MRWLTLLCLLTGCVLPTPEADRGARAPGRADDRPDLGGLADEVHQEANAARRSSSEAPLRWSDALAAVARDHSRDMASRGYFDHVSPEGATAQDRALARGVDCRVDLRGGRSRVGVSENLYQGWRYGRVWTRQTADGATRTYEWLSANEIARQTVGGWLDSPGHRRNLLDRVSTAHGIGVAVDREDRIYVTQVLC
ncbi:CAP domain-containing protein [Rubrivirga marina]|uniref:SCP domain-containing protein n=1 Tax=Rubrivirga marina TaxID=1196024 RepID=A0A271J278_9BACT|nr:CAP domain-containing protein [Rubrivirga marina]PAP77368.1 hypothetical protein BSZ37_13455 [Rubrivirga marina]